MQLRRAKIEEAKKGKKEDVTREILIEVAELQKWIAEQIRKSGRGVESVESSASAFIEYIGRRSGLLLPRGEGQFAFMHLSLQEYFAASYLAEKIRSPRWLRDKDITSGTSKEDLRRYANEITWRDTLIFLFETMSEDPDWQEELAGCIFKEDLQFFSDAKDRNQENTAALLAQLSVDPYSGFTDAMRRNAWERCWHWEIGTQQHVQEVFGTSPSVAAILAASEQVYLSTVWQVFEEVARQIEPSKLSLSGTQVSDLEPLFTLKNLGLLGLSGNPVSDEQVEALKKALPGCNIRS